MAKFVKGQPKMGGKVKGTPNKVTATIRDKFQQLLDGYTIEQMVQDLKAIDNPKDRMMIISNLSEFIVPKLSRSEVSAEVSVKETQFFEIGGQKIKFGD